MAKTRIKWHIIEENQVGRPAIKYCERHKCEKYAYERLRNGKTHTEYSCRECEREKSKIYFKIKSTIDPIKKQQYKDELKNLQIETRKSPSIFCIKHNIEKYAYERIKNDKDTIEYRCRECCAESDKKSYNLKHPAGTKIDRMRCEKHNCEKYTRERLRDNKIEIEYVCRECNYDRSQEPNNKQLKNARVRIRKKEDPSFAAKSDISSGFNRGLKYNGLSKEGNSTWDILPITIKECWIHMEKLFLLPSNLDPDDEPWMTYFNRGPYNPKTHTINPTWQIDHIEPVSHFKFTSPVKECKDIQKCYALENLRPLCAKQNIIEGNRRTPEQITSIKKEISDHIKKLG